MLLHASAVNTRDPASSEVGQGIMGVGPENDVAAGMRTEEEQMCSPAVCATCHKVTYTGCGEHVDQVMASVPVDRRCTCR